MWVKKHLVFEFLNTRLNIFTLDDGKNEVALFVQVAAARFGLNWSVDVFSQLLLKRGFAFAWLRRWPEPSVVLSLDVVAEVWHTRSCKRESHASC